MLKKTFKITGMLFCVFMWLQSEGYAQNLTKLPTNGIWINAQELAALPISGDAWNRVRAAADKLVGMEARGGHESVHDVHVMAAALVAVRLNDDARRRLVADHLIKAVDNHVENDGNSLSLTRTLSGYIIAADLINLKALDPAKDQKFREWLEFVVYQLKLDNANQVEKHEIRGNNHGTQAGVARIAAAIYLGKLDDLNRAAAVCRGWLGERTSYAGFKWGEMCWQADASNPVGINPKGAKMMVAGAMRDVDGVQPDDQRRAGCPDSQTKWPPRTDVHVWGGLQGAVGQAFLLSRAGFDAWNWGDKAVLRAMSWQYDPQRGSATASGDDHWILPLVDFAYGSTFWKGETGYGKQVGWTDWTHAKRGGGTDPGQKQTSIRGAILNLRSDVPLTNAMVQLKVGAEVRHTTVTNFLGEFTFSPIEPGSYQVLASKDGFESASTNVTVAQDEEVLGVILKLNPLVDSTAPLAPTNVRASVDN